MGKWFSLVTLDMIGFSVFGSEFRAIESPSTSSGSNTEEKPSSELADAYE